MLSHAVLLQVPLRTIGLVLRVIHAVRVLGHQKPYDWYGAVIGK